MKKISMLYSVLLVSISLFAQKQFNDPNVQARPVKNFHAIKVSNGIELLLTQGNSETVAVSADEVEHRDKIITEVDNGVLKIYYDQNFVKQLRGRDKKLRAYVSFINLNEIDASSGSNVKVEGVIKSGKLKMDASSGAVFKGEVEIDNMNIDQSRGLLSAFRGK